MSSRKIHCCGCGDKVEARLTDGAEIYPNRDELSTLPFWRCDQCGNSVGCHYRTTSRIRPLGCIPTPELRSARKNIHALMEPLFKEGVTDRKALYEELSGRIGWKYHTKNLRSVEEASEVQAILLEYHKTWAGVNV